LRARGGAAHAGGIRIDRQSHLDRGAPCGPGLWGLLGDEGRGRESHQEPRPRARRAWDPRQLHRTRRDPDARHRADRGAHTACARRAPRRRRGRRAVPRIRSLALRLGRDAPRRRRELRRRRLAEARRWELRDLMRAVAVESLDDPRVADYRNVRDADLRVRDGLFMTEGRLNVKRLITVSPYRTRSVFATEAGLRG